MSDVSELTKDEVATNNMEETLSDLWMESNVGHLAETMSLKVDIRELNVASRVCGDKPSFSRPSERKCGDNSTGQGVGV